MIEKETETPESNREHCPNAVAYWIWPLPVDKPEKKQNNARV